MKASGHLLFAALALCAATALGGAAARREPHIGYVFPGGGRRGDVVEVTVGGQFLRGVTDVYVSGEGVRASVIQHYRIPRNINGEQGQELRRRVAELRDERLAELEEQGYKIDFPGRRRGAGREARRR